VIGTIALEVDVVMCVRKTTEEVAMAVNAVAVLRIVESGQIADDLWGSRLKCWRAIKRLHFADPL